MQEPGDTRASLPDSAMARPPILQRMIVGSWMLITIDTLIFGFVIFLPQFFLRQGLTITKSFGHTLGRLATVVSPFVVGKPMVTCHLPGVMGLMVGLLAAAAGG